MLNALNSFKKDSEEINILSQIKQKLLLLLQTSW